MTARATSHAQHSPLQNRPHAFHNETSKHAGVQHSLRNPGFLNLSCWSRFLLYKLLSARYCGNENLSCLFPNKCSSHRAGKLNIVTGPIGFRNSECFNIAHVCIQSTLPYNELGAQIRLLWEPLWNSILKNSLYALLPFQPLHILKISKFQIKKASSSNSKSWP